MVYRKTAVTLYSLGILSSKRRVFCFIAVLRGWHSVCGEPAGVCGVSYGQSDPGSPTETPKRGNSALSRGFGMNP